MGMTAWYMNPSKKSIRLWIGALALIMALAPWPQSGFTGLAPLASAAVTQGTTLTMPGNSLGLVGHSTFDGKDMIGNVRDTSGQGGTMNAVYDYL